jgi:hypothetical protein
MSKVEVTAMMGQPDEINPVFDRHNWNKQIGESYVYLLSRKSESGSFEEVDEHLVRVIFDVEESKVSNIDKW